MLLGAATLFAFPLHAGRGTGGSAGGGGGGFGGQCPNGFEPGTRIQDCTPAQDGSGSQYRNKSGSKGANNNGTGQRLRDGSGQATGQGKGQRNGGGQGTGNPADCPNYGG